MAYGDFSGENAFGVPERHFLKGGLAPGGVHLQAQEGGHVTFRICLIATVLSPLKKQNKKNPWDVEDYLKFLKYLKSPFIPPQF